MGGGWSTLRPGRFTPAKETLFPLYRRLGGPWGQCGWFRQILPSAGFEAQTTKIVASRYAIPAAHNMQYVLRFHGNNGYANGSQCYVCVH